LTNWKLFCIFGCQKTRVMGLFNCIRFKRFLFALLLCGLSVHVFGADTMKKFTLNFYGHILLFDWDSDYYSSRKKFFDDLSAEKLADYLVGDTNLNEFVGQSDAYAREMNLDGMAYLMLVNKTAVKISGGKDEKFKTGFMYALLFRKGYDVLLGVNDKRVTVYGHTAFSIKNVLYVNRNGKTYYDLSFDQRKEPLAERLAVLPVNDAAKAIRLNKYVPPSLHNSSEVKTIPFEHEGNIYFFTVNLNKSLVQYYNDLPDIEMSQVYLNYGLSEKGNNTLVQQIKEATAYMSKEKVVNFILDFVQSFDYGKDIDILGKEKFAFPEESIASDYTDCEDRSMLFAYLVREVAHLQSIGLFYPGAAHMNVAVESWRKAGKADVKAYEMDFVVCEPSGKGLKAGQQTMDLSMANVIKW
jgi:hypothetical protein